MKRPCTRCRNTGKRCVFFEVPRDLTVQRLEILELQVQRLAEQVDEMQNPVRSSPLASMSSAAPPQQDSEQPLARESYDGSSLMGIAQCMNDATRSDLISSDDQQSPLSSTQDKIATQSSVPGRTGHISSSKRKQCVFEAVSAFQVFFQGCDRFIPIFDPRFDTFDSVRARSSILLNAICTVGCRIENQSGFQISDLLDAELKKWINVVIQNPKMNRLESIQAMLVVACYSAERSLILSFATRMAVDQELPAAYEQLTGRLALSDMDDRSRLPEDIEEVELLLMRKARTWFGLLVLEHIFHLDAGKPAGIRFTGDTRRCRVLLNHSFSTTLDLRLLSQVELNLLRAKINDSLALRYIGVENVAAMSTVEHDILLMAKRSAKKHLKLIITDPDLYLSRLKYAMDFVWAKCTFCFLFLLKLSRILPESAEENMQLLEDGNCLLQQMSKGGGVSSNNHSNGEIYLQIIRLGIEKFERALRENVSETDGGLADSGASEPFWKSFDAQTDLQSFVPKQFVLEWDFPGLNLFYFPTSWQSFFGDFAVAV
ncbi:hypothetical protein VTN00DRAFT_3289 [Thermoascus crustaceus]|uniref:uncharacterized protein n=1 Tax=Thermoascus crustaceus TaxID=5088 RepID=UPI0037426F8B